MPGNRVTGMCLSAFAALCFFVFVHAAPAACQVAEPPEKVQPGQQQHHEHHHLHMTMGEEKCEPKFTYEEGPLSPSHWPGLCNTGRMQAPIDIQHAEKLRIDTLKISYQPADLDIINDCNQYRILVRFPDNYWLTVGKKPYNLTELHFREPGDEESMSISTLSQHLRQQPHVP